MLNKEQLSKVITQGYSNISLSVMADFKKEYATDLADSKFLPQTVNKLTEAYAKNRISAGDLFHVMKFSNHTVKNESYVDDFLNSIDDGVYHKTAANIFVAVNYENCTYSEALDLVKFGAFYPTEYASLSVTDEVAKQLDRMGVQLRGCKGFNNCYDIAHLKESIDNGDAVFVQDKSLALQVHEMMKLPDWEKFRDEVRYVMGKDIDKLTGDKLAELRMDYVKENYSVALFHKVKDEYDSFMAEIRSGSVENAIQNAYDIVTKGEITLYCEEYTPDLTEQQYKALLSSQNTLSEVYKQWCDNGELHGLNDIGIALEETADRIQISIDRDMQEKLSNANVKSAPVIEQVVKPKHKSR